MTTQPEFVLMRTWITKSQRLFSLFGFWLALLCALFVIFNQYETLKTLDSFYRTTMATLCLLFGFIVTSINLRLGILGCLFALPVLPDLTWQIQQYFGYGRILATHAAGLDLLAGLFFGAIVNHFRHRRLKDFSLSLPWQAGLVMAMITSSVMLAIARNLYQTSSPFYVQSLIYNLMHFRSIGWHDDYRPIADWLAYASAFSLIAVLAPALKSFPDRNEVVFKPLIAGLVVAALVGFRQSVFGMGLSVVQLNFRLDQFGFMALGFQPDIHAFGAQMLIGAVGLFGYMYYTKNISSRLALLLLVIPLCWVGLFLSKSKASLGLAIVLLILMAAFWFFRHSKYTTRIIICLSALLMVGGFSGWLFTNELDAILTPLMHRIGINDWAALNVKLSYRPEVYMAAFQMFGLFPLLGLGQSEFYHQSANASLTNSYFLSVEQNGENAHNYFLQVLVENGLLGFLLFALLVSYPLWRITNKKTLIPAVVALGAIFAGNIFSHSMLVRENLFTAASVIALMYGWLAAENASIAAPTHLTTNAYKKTFYVYRDKLYQPRILFVCTLSLSILVLHEVYQSFRQQPFLSDIQCMKERPASKDGWTSGYYRILDVPAGSQGLKLNLTTTQPDVVKRPLPATLGIFFNERLLFKKDFVLNKTGPQSLELDFPDGRSATPDDYQIELFVKRCFVPRNYGMNGDGRRLGLQIHSMDWKY